MIVAPRCLRTRLRLAVASQLRNVSPGRRLRLQQAVKVVESYAEGRDDIRLMDAGGEEGLLCLALARRHPNWTLVTADIAAEPLRRGRAWARAAGVPVHYLRCDVQRPLVQSRFDIIVALETLEEIGDDAAAIRSLAAALRRGGLFVAQVPTVDWTPVLRGAERTWRREVRHGYVSDELVKALADSGLDARLVQVTFRRTAALAQDVRDWLRPHSQPGKLLLLPFMAVAVVLERVGLTWGPARGLMVVAIRR